MQYDSFDCLKFLPKHDVISTGTPTLKHIIHHIKTFVSFVILALFLHACASTPSSQQNKLDVKLIAYPDSSFQSNLASAYQRYYLDEDNFNLSPSIRDFFYSKTQRAIEGKVVNPVVIPDALPLPSLKAALLEQREFLSFQLSKDHRAGDIPILAQAQAAFDCKIILIISKNQDDALNTCSRRYDNLISRLETPHWPQLEYFVFFESNRSVLEREAIQTLKDIAHLKKKDPFATLVVAGNTDKRGSPEANYRLAVQRARAVRNILLQFGVREAEINLLEERKTYPAFFALAQDTSENAQRRVSILVDRDLLQ